MAMIDALVECNGRPQRNHVSRLLYKGSYMSSILVSARSVLPAWYYGSNSRYLEFTAGNENDSNIELMRFPTCEASDWDVRQYTIIENMFYRLDVESKGNKRTWG